MPRWLRLYLPRWYLQRFPLMLGAFLLVYVPFALLVLPTVFRTTLVLTARGLGWVTLFAVVVAAVVVMATRRTVLLYGPARFSIPWPATDAPLSRWKVSAHLSLAAPIVVIAAWLSATDGEIGFPVVGRSGPGRRGGGRVLRCRGLVHSRLPGPAIPRSA